jgi:hypothetical protein
MIQYNLHKLPEGFIITSDETPIKKGELYYNTVNYQIFKLDGVVFNHCKKVIAQQDQIIFNLSEEEQKEIGWYDVCSLGEDATNLRILKHKTANQVARQYYDGYLDGFQKAQELLSDRRFTLEDIKKAIRYGFDVGFCSNSSNKVKNDLQSEESFISQPKSWKVEGILENDKFKITKIL